MRAIQSENPDAVDERQGAATSAAIIAETSAAPDTDKAETVLQPTDTEAAEATLTVGVTLPGFITDQKRFWPNDKDVEAQGLTAERVERDEREAMRRLKQLLKAKLLKLFEEKRALVEEKKIADEMREAVLNMDDTDDEGQTSPEPSTATGDQPDSAANVAPKKRKSTRVIESDDE